MDSANPARQSNQTRVVAVIVIVIVIVAASGVGYYLYQNSLQPNMQVVNIQFGYAQTNQQTSVVQNLGRVSGTGSFSYTATSTGVVDIALDNSFSFFASKQVMTTYTIAGLANSQTFTIGAGAVESIESPLYIGQSVSGSFTTSGGSGNDIDFSISLITCSQTIPFTATLVNSGSANGYGVVTLQVTGSSNVGNNLGPQTSTSVVTSIEGSAQATATAPLAQNGTVFSNKYYVPQGGQIPISGTASIQDCGSHTLSPAVSQQKG